MEGSEEQDIDEDEAPSDGRGAVTFQKIDGKFMKIFNKLTDKILRYHVPPCWFASGTQTRLDGHPFIEVLCDKGFE